MARMRTLTAGLVLVVVACIAAACGGSDGNGNESGSGSKSTTSAKPTVTREQFIAEADEFCKDANEEAKAKNERVQLIVRRAETEDEALRAITPIYEEGYERQRELLDEFEKIEKPPADREVLDKLAAAREEQTALLGRLADAARSRDIERFRSLGEEANRVQTRAQALAQGYGFKECGSGENEAD